MIDAAVPRGADRTPLPATAVCRYEASGPADAGPLVLRGGCVLRARHVWPRTRCTCIAASPRRSFYLS